MRKLSAFAQHALAAEYVLGTLRGRARQRFETLVREDAALGAIVRGWEDWLTPLADRIAPVQPPERVWRAIEARIVSRAHAAAAPSGLWSGTFWRGFATALGAAVVAAVLLVPRSQQGPEAGPSMVAVLATPEAEARMVVERHADKLVVRMVKPWADMPGQDLELWAIPKDGKPRSLGLVRYNANTELRTASLDQKLTGTVAFAVSREPKGGSPSADGPTGPVLCSGAIVRPQQA